MNRILICFLILSQIFCFQAGAEKNKIRVLILSGSNNHEWQRTTPVLENMFLSSEYFESETSLQPDTLSGADLQKYDVVLSNWNSWPENDLRWSEKLENSLLNFIKSGGGFVTFHASTSAFYKWPKFKEISVGAWVEKTNHGKPGATKVEISNSNHPITKGLQGFQIFDELWNNAEKNESFKVLGTATNIELPEAEQQKQGAIFVKEYGKGRIFHTMLGHKARTLRNIGFQTLLLRGTEWAAKGKVKQEIPQDLQIEKKSPSKFKWAQTDTSITLLNNKAIVWQYNFQEFHQKPFFHPIYLGRNNLTSLSPDDHIWHAGQWFSWKYINRVNYWEYVSSKEYRSEGTTDVKNVRFMPNKDFSAEIELDIVYHPHGGEDVMAEKRIIKVSAPEKSKQITMDYQFEFKALVDTVVIDRTPLENEENGKSWGGYGGLSLRFNQSFVHPKTLSSVKEKEVHGKNGDWFYMGFSGIDGKQIGSQIIVSPNSKRKEAAWYVTQDPNQPFFYFGPAYLFYKPFTLLKGEKLNLNYRVNHFEGEITQSQLEEESKKYQKQNQ